MKLAMAQMRLDTDPATNLQHARAACRQAGAQGADLLFFPEVQLTPFFPQYPVAQSPYPLADYPVEPDGPALQALAQEARSAGCYVSPNVWLDDNGRRTDASLLYDRTGRLVGRAEMVHIFQAPLFYEQDYYAPSREGFRVFETDFGRVGIVICFDRHLPESIRTCALRGADLVIVPTANVTAEPLETFEWEMRIQAMQSQVFVALCNRVGVEFAGESLVAAPDGSLMVKAGADPELICVDLDLEAARTRRAQIPWLPLRRPDLYA